MHTMRSLSPPEQSGKPIFSIQQRKQDRKFCEQKQKQVTVGKKKALIFVFSKPAIRGDHFLNTTNHSWRVPIMCIESHTLHPGARSCSCSPSGQTDNNAPLTSPTVSLGSQAIVTVSPSRLANKKRNVILLGSNLYAGRDFLDDETMGPAAAALVVLALAAAEGGGVVVAGFSGVVGFSAVLSDA
jgi:hypothetical protein